MFGIEFSELVVILIVSLIVIGPDKLPKVARTVGKLLGRSQQYIKDINLQINEEFSVEELQKLKLEIQENTKYAMSGKYQVGQVIDHEKEKLDATSTELNQRKTNVKQSQAESGAKKIVSKDSLKKLKSRKKRVPIEQ